MHFFLYKKIQRAIAVSLVSIFVFSPILTIPTQKAHAQIATFDATAAGQRVAELAQDAATLVEETASTLFEGISASTLSALGITKWSLDGVAWSLAKMVLNASIRSTARWIASGFQGSPMYVTDPGAFLLNIADEKAGEILYGSKLGFLCSPINFRIVLNLYYQSIRNKNPLRCTLTGAAANVERFVNGTFSAGGWPSWLDVSVNPVNSSMGGALSGQIALVSNISVEQQERQRQWSINADFLSTEKCTTGPDGVKKCEKVSPGKTIADTLSFGVTVGDRSLIEADAINEVIGALLGQMLITGLKGARGLFGLGQAGSSASSYGAGFDTGAPLDASGNVIPCAQRSYLDQMGDPLCDPTLSNINNSLPFEGSGSIAQAIRDEESFQAIHRRVISASLSTIRDAERRGLGCGINDGVIDDAKGYIATASSTIRSSEARVVELSLIQAEANQSDEKKLEVMTRFVNMIGSRSIRTSADNIRTLSEVENILKQINNNSDTRKPDTSLRSRIQDCPRAPDPADTPIYNDTGGSEGGGDGM